VSDGVRAARRDDVRGIAAALTSAFFADPAMVWVSPDDGRRPLMLRRFYAAIARWEAIPSGSTLVAEDATGKIVGAAVWRRRGGGATPTWREVPFALAAGRALGRDMGRMSALGGAASRARPRVQHWYLQLLGIAADTQRGGFGSALVQRGLARADGDRMPAYLETTDENVEFYARFGFRVTGQLATPRGAPMQSSLWRDPVL
jgi:ribosomal protein S18 acetylase RimI-like enzyme